jgi:hypothetical protein
MSRGLKAIRKMPSGKAKAVALIDLCDKTHRQNQWFLRWWNPFAFILRPDDDDLIAARDELARHYDIATRYE